MSRALILLVDDDQELAESLAEILESVGHAVTVAANGKEAVERFRERNFDIVISDVRMPIMNGVESFLEIRKLKPDARVLLMTGLREPIAESALAAGALGLLQKPFDLSQLLPWIEDAVQGEALD